MKKKTSNSDSTIPFDVQVEILKKLPVKPLMKFRSVSKEYKSLIDSRSFITEYGSREAHPHRPLVRYTQHTTSNVEKYVCLLDNDDEYDSNFTQQEFAPRVPNVLTKLLNVIRIVGTSHGLLCLYGFNYSSNETCENDMVILWNPSIRKSIGITLPGELGWSCNDSDFGFGVCPFTNDPIVVKSINRNGWQVEIFTLSSGIWNRVPSTNLPSRESVLLTGDDQVVIDRFIYFLAYDKTVAVERDESDDFLKLIVSFDMTTKEFTILDLPNNLAYQCKCLSMSKIRESLVVLEYNWDTYKSDCVVWMMMMEQGVKKPFTKLFTINEDVCSLLGFMKNGDPIIVTEDDYDHSEPAELKVYERCSQHVKQLGIYGEEDSFFMGSYTESLLLLDQPDCFNK